jgi:cytochrome c556
MAVFAAIAFAAPAAAQDASPDVIKDLVFARKIMMNTIGANMDEIETMLQTGKIDLTEGKEHADTISVMLMAFPHLFRAESNQWKPNVARDPGVDTFASPDVWMNYAEFYKLAAATSKTAFSAARARDEAEFRARGTELRAACDTCHAAYLKPE